MTFGARTHNFPVLNEGCPYLIGQKVWPGYNDLKTLYPELAQEWHPVKNGKLTPSNITAGSSKLVWWYLPYDDPICQTVFAAMPLPPEELPLKSAIPWVFQT